jgi:hypothetical protein
MYCGGKGEKIDFRFGKDGCIVGGRNEKPNFRFGDDVLLGKETKFQIWERMCYWEKGKNQILDLGHDVLCGKVKTIKLQIWPIWPF